MTNWPQYVTIAWLLVRFVILVYQDMGKETEQERFAGFVGSVISTYLPWWVLDAGGFFKSIE